MGQLSADDFDDANRSHLQGLATWAPVACGR